MENDSLLIGFTVLVILYCLCKYGNHKQNLEPFSLFGLESEELKLESKELKQMSEFTSNISDTKTKTACKDNYAYLGYDNPYIYPYNYNVNQNYPTDRFTQPGWVRQMDLDKNNYKNFPGYGY